MKLTEVTYVEWTNDNAGYCKACDEVTDFGGVEPDAMGYPCPECNKNAMMGVEQAMLLGHLVLTD
jgi:anaerobic ribonucleoside-triphosphate reductase